VMGLGDLSKKVERIERGLEQDGGKGKTGQGFTVSDCRISLY